GFKNAQGQDVAFTVPDLPPLTPTASLAGPSDGGTVAQSELNNRGFIDVTYVVPAGKGLDDSSITDLAPEFTIAATTGSIVLDSTQAPVLINTTPTAHTFRYWVLSSGAANITLTALDTSWALSDLATGTTSANPTSGGFTFDATHVATPYIDVAL